MRTGTLEYIRSDNGPEFTAVIMGKWLADLGVETENVELGNPWGNGFYESFHEPVGDDFLEDEEFCMIKDAKVLTDEWRGHYYNARPRSALGNPPLVDVHHEDYPAPQSS